MNVFKKARQVIAAVENPEIPFLYYILLFFSSVTLRNFLEIFSDQAKVAFKFLSPEQLLYLSVWQGLAISFLHYYVFWTALFITLGIIFFLLTKEDINKTLRAVLCFSFILNITPIFDLIITAGKGLDISYIYPESISELLPIPKGLTPGMRLTSIVGIILSFIYCRVKTNSFKKGLLGGFLLYLLLMIGSVLPFILNTFHPVPIIRTLLIIIFMELVLGFYLWNRAYFLALAKDVRWYRVLHYLSMLILGLLLTGEPILRVLSQNWDTFLLTFFTLFSFWIAAIMFNNIVDCDIDRISNPRRPLASLSIPQNDYRNIALSVVCLSGVFGLGVNFQTFFFGFLLMGISLLYSLPPLRFKRIPIFSKLFISFSSLIVVMLGYIFAAGELLEFPHILTWYFLIFVSLSMNFIDLKDYEGDKQAGILTLPVMFGLKRAKFIIGGFFVISYCLLSWVFLDLRLFIPGLVLGGLQFFLINKRRYQEKWILLTYLVSLLALFIYLAGTFPKVPPYRILSAVSTISS